MQNCLMMLALKHVNREEIQDVSKDVFDRYKDYMLGDYVWSLSPTDLQGQQIQTPPWSLVLSYEHAIRKRAYNLMLTEKLMIAAALEKAWKCPTTKERHFITPLALYLKGLIHRITMVPVKEIGTRRAKAKEKANQRDRRKDQDKVRMEKRYATGSMRASATIRNANLPTCATSVTKRDTMR